MVKREHTPSPPLPNGRRPVTEGSIRYAPLPENCQKPHTNFVRNRRMWAEEEVKKIRDINPNITVTRVFTRGDGMVIDWRSSIPVMSDTLLPTAACDEFTPQSGALEPPEAIDVHQSRNSSTPEHATRPRGNSTGMTFVPYIQIDPVESKPTRSVPSTALATQPSFADQAGSPLRAQAPFPRGEDVVRASTTSQEHKQQQARTPSVPQEYGSPPIQAPFMTRNDGDPEDDVQSLPQAPSISQDDVQSISRPPSFTPHDDRVSRIGPSTKSAVPKTSRESRPTSVRRRTPPPLPRRNTIHRPGPVTPPAPRTVSSLVRGNMEQSSITAVDEAASLSNPTRRSNGRTLIRSEHSTAPRDRSTQNIMQSAPSSSSEALSQTFTPEAIPVVSQASQPGHTVEDAHMVDEVRPDTMRHPAETTAEDISDNETERLGTSAALDFLRKYTVTFDFDRSALASAYSCNATFSVRIINLSSTSESRRSVSSEDASRLEQGRLDIMASLLSLSPDWKFCLTGPAKLDYDVLCLDGGNLLLVCHAADDKWASEQCFLLQAKERDKQDQETDGLWSYVAVTHHMTFREKVQS